MGDECNMVLFKLGRNVAIEFGLRDGIVQWVGASGCVGRVQEYDFPMLHIRRVRLEHLWLMGLCALTPVWP